jgi:hypothetical protein
MDKLDLKPHLIFWNSIPIVLVMGYAERNASVVLNLGDAYYRIEPLDLTIWIAGLYAIIGLGYWTMRKLNRQLSPWMNLIHMICTAGGVILIVGMIFLIQEIESAEGGQNLGYIEDLNSGISVLLLIVGVAQGVFLINWLNGWMRPNGEAVNS